MLHFTPRTHLGARRKRGQQNLKGIKRLLKSEQDANRDNLVGRQWLLDELTEWFQSGGKRACLMAPPGAGKTRVAHALARAVPGSMVVDFSYDVYGMEWPQELTPSALGGRVPSLLILDSVEAAPPAVWRSRRLAHDFPGIPILFCYRPGVHHESLQSPGCHLSEISPTDPCAQADLKAYLDANGIGYLTGHISTFGEARYLVENPHKGAAQLASYYAALWRETTRPFAGADRILMEQLALLLSDIPEPLTFGALSDFTGIPSVQILEALDNLSPLLSAKNGTLALFSPGLATGLKSTFSRDLGAVHGRIVSFFRDTYPSWQEMHDPYGWRYLVLHCDRLARASRKKDFSVLHWLNEGSFSQLKLERTGMLPSVLKDLRLSLLASLETEDLPRIVSFGCRIAKLRKQESVKTVHRLADAGHLQLAQENGHLVTGESQRFLVWLLFATQTLEAKKYEATLDFLEQAHGYATVDLNELEVELAASLIGGMLSDRAVPEECHDLLEQLLDMNGNPWQSCIAYRTVARNHGLAKSRRKLYLARGLERAQLIPAGKTRTRLVWELESRVARHSRSAPQENAFPLFLSQAKNPEKEFQKKLKSVKNHDLPLATLAAALIPVSQETWTNGAFAELLELLAKIPDEETKKHALAGLIQSLDDSYSGDLPTRLLDKLSEQICELPDAAERSRYLARFAVLLCHKGRPREAQQRISLAAAGAFGIANSSGRSSALLALAEMVATTGAIGRARDLAFHALELRSKLRDLDLESQQLVRLLSSASAQSNQSAEEIVRLGSSLRFEDSPAELEAKGRAMVVLAAGLSRLGSEHHAKLYRSKAAEAVRGIDELQLRVHLLSDLASAFHSSGEEKEARKLIKEARGLFDEQEEARGLMAATALLKVYMVVENKTQTKKMFLAARETLEQQESSGWLVSQSFLDFLQLAQSLGRIQEVLPTLNESRRAKDLSDQERLGILRAEVRLNNYQKAESHAAELSDIVLRCHAHIDLALALLSEDHQRAMHHLTQIPLESFRCEGIRRLALLNSSDIRPTEQVRVREVLCQLTLLAMEHPDAMDSVLSRWIQACPDRETILAIADKMNWSTGAGSMFRQAMESRPITAEEPESPEQEPEPAPETVDEPEDDGFQAMNLTKPSES
jgi:hypothetical protein